jgi:hypothetical protein
MAENKDDCSRQCVLDEVIAHLQTLLVLPAMRQLYVESELSLYNGLDATNMETAIMLLMRLKARDASF